MSSDRKYTYGFLFLLIVTTLIIYWPFFSGDFIPGGEAADLLLPILSHIRETVAQWDWPLWNKYQSQGLATSIMPIYWNPLYLLCGAIFQHPGLALNALYLTLIFIAGMGFYYASKPYVSEVKSAILGGLCYPLIGFFAVNGTDMGMIAAAAFIPFLYGLNHRYQTTGKVKHLIVLLLAYYTLTTMTSVGFVIMTSGILLIQAWWFIHREDRPVNRLSSLAISMVAAGFLLWRILWERLNFFLPNATTGIEDPDSPRSLHELLSFILPKASGVPIPPTQIQGADSFHYYIGIITLVLAITGLAIKRRPLERHVGIMSLGFLILAMTASAIEHSGPTFAGMSGSAFSTTMKILLTTSLLFLGMRGFEKTIREFPQAKYILLAFSLIAAGLGFYIENTRATVDQNTLMSWFVQIDAWKSAFFLLMAAIALWFRRENVRWWLIGSLILTDLGLNHFLNQDQNLLHDYPTSSFVEAISYPDKINSDIDLYQPIGKFSDEDIPISTLKQNTGTLSKQIVRDGYWPWSPDTSALRSSLQDATLRYPLFYFSRDTSGAAYPTLINYEDVIHVQEQKDHVWELSILSQYEKYLVLNQNYDINWTAFMDEARIPIIKTEAGRMMMPIKPGLHLIRLEYMTNGLHNIFGFTLALCVLLILILIRKKAFPIPGLAAGLPIVLILLLNPATPRPQPPVIQPTKTDSADYFMNYEVPAPSWFIRGNQLTTSHAVSGYRAEALNQEAVYSATLRLQKADLHEKNELRYRFFIKSPRSVQAGVALKTYGSEDESYNIEYIHSLDTGGWNIIEGSFPLDDLSGPLVQAEWYIWNYKNEDFLIDDIEIKLIP